MFYLPKVYFIFWACCIISLEAFSIRQNNDEADANIERMDGFDFTFDDFDDNEDEDSSNNQDELKKPLRNKTPLRTLEPEAEILPADFDKVKPPGVDHMEMTRFKEDTFQVEPTNKKTATINNPTKSKKDDLSFFQRLSKYSLIGF